MARFGKHVVMRNNMTSEQHARFMKHCAARLPEVTAEIDGHVSAIAEIVGSYDPLTILQRGYMVCVFPFIVPSAERDGETGTGQRLLDYVQSIFIEVSKDLDAEEFEESGIADVFKGCSGGGADHLRCLHRLSQVKGNASRASKKCTA